MLIPIQPKDEWPEASRAFYDRMAELEAQTGKEFDTPEDIREDFNAYIESCNADEREAAMKRAEAKRLACRILASDCYHHLADGAGQDSDEIKTEADRERLRIAFEELEREMQKRGKQ